MIRMTAIAAAISLTGCSVGMKTVASSWNPHTRPQCDARATRPLVDASLAVTSLAASGYLFWRYPPGQSGEPCALCPTGPALALATVGFVLGLSALSGIDHVRECRTAHRRHAQSIGAGDENGAEER